MNKIIKYNILSIFIMIFSSSLAQELDVPIDLQFPIIMKILSFERNIKSYQNINFVILYQKNYRQSLNIKNKIFELINENSYNEIQNKPVSYKAVNINDINELELLFQKNNINILYIAPVRSIDLARLSVLTRRKKIITISSVIDYMDYGFSVSIMNHGDKPLPVINLSASRAEGADFSSQLLKISKVID